MAFRECLEGFVLRRALREVGAQQPLERLRQFGGGNVAQDLASQLAPFAEAAADEDVVPLDFRIPAGCHLRAEQADIADVMLRAGMRAAGQVNVQRRVQGKARVEIVRDRQRMALGVACGKFAAGIAGAGDEAGADRRCFRAQPEFGERGLHRVPVAFGDIRQDQVLPYRQADRRRCRWRSAMPARPRICAAVIFPTGRATPA